MMSKVFLNKYLLVLLSGLILTIAWPHTGSLTFLIFIGFVPLLHLERVYSDSNSSSKGIFFPAFISFLIWNIGVTWFIFMIRTPGSTYWEELMARITASGLAFVLNSVFMAFIFWLFHYTRKRLGDRLGYASLVVYWLSFEYLHLNWDINWPWLNLGNVFAEDTWLIQWYEYTGVSGGSLWILVINIMIYGLWRRWEANKKSFSGMAMSSIRLSLVLVIPIVVSIVIYNTYEEKGEKMGAIALQPNVDPYNQKFEEDPVIQLEDMMSLADSMMDSEVKLVLLPETALLERARVSKTKNGLYFSGPWDGHYEDMLSMKAMRNMTIKYPDLTIITGLSDRKAFKDNEKLTPTARHIESLDLYYDSYNSLLSVSAEYDLAVYRKSKLVPGVESVPFGALMKKLEDFALDLGGTTGSLGTQEERTSFEVSSHKIGAMVCYESIYGEFVSEFVYNGAEALAISTNDSWWQTSPGYKQLLAYARLRAIENRRSIIRSANTGISCFIDQRGNINEHSKWWTKTGVRGDVRLNKEMTFYSKNGDAIYRISSFLMAIFLLYALVKVRLGS